MLTILVAEKQLKEPVVVSSDDTSENGTDPEDVDGGDTDPDAEDSDNSQVKPYTYKATQVHAQWQKEVTPACHMH